MVFGVVSSTVSERLKEINVIKIRTHAGNLIAKPNRISVRLEEMNRMNRQRDSDLMDNLHYAAMQTQPVTQPEEQWCTMEEVFKQAGEKFPFMVEWQFSKEIVKEFQIVGIDPNFGCWCTKEGNYFSELSGKSQEYRLIKPHPGYINVTIQVEWNECTAESCPDLLRNGHNSTCKHWKNDG